MGPWFVRVGRLLMHDVYPCVFVCFVFAWRWRRSFLLFNTTSCISLDVLSLHAGYTR